MYMPPKQRKGSNALGEPNPQIKPKHYAGLTALYEIQNISNNLNKIRIPTIDLTNKFLRGVICESEEYKRGEEHIERNRVRLMGNNRRWYINEYMNESPRENWSGQNISGDIWSSCLSREERSETLSVGSGFLSAREDDDQNSQLINQLDQITYKQPTTLNICSSIVSDSMPEMDRSNRSKKGRVRKVKKSIRKVNARHNIKEYNNRRGPMQRKEFRQEATLDIRRAPPSDDYSNIFPLLFGLQIDDGSWNLTPDLLQALGRGLENYSVHSYMSKIPHNKVKNSWATLLVLAYFSANKHKDLLFIRECCGKYEKKGRQYLIKQHLTEEMISELIEEAESKFSPDSRVMKATNAIESTNSSSMRRPQLSREGENPERNLLPPTSLNKQGLEFNSGNSHQEFPQEILASTNNPLSARYKRRCKHICKLNICAKPRISRAMRSNPETDGKLWFTNKYSNKLSYLKSLQGFQGQFECNSFLQELLGIPMVQLKRYEPKQLKEQYGQRSSCIWGTLLIIALFNKYIHNETLIISKAKEFLTKFLTARELKKYVKIISLKLIYKYFGIPPLTTTAAATAAPD